MRISLLAAAAVLSAPALAGPYYPDPAIVWPTYLLIEKSYDSALSCPKLAAEIDKVSGDISLLAKAQVQVQEALRNSFDTQNSAGREVDGALLNTAYSRAGSLYSEGRMQIRESRRIAEARRDHLKSLEKTCHPEP
jgi:hypothetical protein